MLLGMDCLMMSIQPAEYVVHDIWPALNYSPIEITAEIGQDVLTRLVAFTQGALSLLAEADGDDE
jgi:hypothetical protein